MTCASHPAEGGFVRVPRAWLHLPVSPQAKTLLMLFCAHADEDGHSWFSYEQLGAILHRSRSSVAGYVAELREAGVVRSTPQTYGNGYNYRLLIALEGWRGLLAAWAARRASARSRAEDEGPADAGAAPRRDGRRPSAGPAPDASRSKAPDVTTEASSTSAAARLTVRRSERSVRPVERKDPKGPKTEIHQTYSSAATRRLWSDELEDEWRHHRPSDRDPPFQVIGTPRRGLLEAVLRHAEALRSTCHGGAGDARDDARLRLAAFAEAHQLEAPREALDALGAELASLAPLSAQRDAAMEALAGVWKSHWRRLPSPAQLATTAGPAVATAGPPAAVREEAARFGTRAWIAGWLLRDG